MKIVYLFVHIFRKISDVSDGNEQKMNNITIDFLKSVGEQLSLFVAT